MDVTGRDVTDRMVRLRYRTTATDGGTTIRVKIEINTREKVPFRAHRTVPFEVRSPWFSASADVRTFEPEELLATKLRALYQRRKGRELFDLWFGLAHLDADPQLVAHAFRHYLPATEAPAESIRQNLSAKLNDAVFLADLEPLLREVPQGYSTHQAARVLEERLLPFL